MKICYILVVLAVLLWKAYYAWLRAVNTYVRDRRDHDSLREYLLGNGATPNQALRPFLLHALQRAYRPLLSQWRLLAILVAVAILAGLVADGLTVLHALLLLLILILLVALTTLAAFYGYAMKKRL